MEACPTGTIPTSTGLARSVLRAALIAALGVIAAGCGGGESCEDKITIGSGQSCSGGSDAVTVDLPIFYVKRPVRALPQGMQPNTAIQLRQFDFDSDLYMRTSASPSATEVNITGALTNHLGDVRDVDVSWDGRKVVFAMRFPYVVGNNNTIIPEVDQPSSWDLYEYDIPSATLRGLIVDPLRANRNLPRDDDRFPHYLPDGRIVFSSTRQRTSKAILLDENKPQYQALDENDNEPAFLLHVLDPRDSSLRQISFNQNHDLDSAVLPNGQIVFSRWDGRAGPNAGRGPDAVSLYRANPDGSGLELLYGRQPCTHLMTNGNSSCASTTTTPIQFLSPRPLQNGRLMALIRPMVGTDESGDLVSIEYGNYAEFTQSTLPNAGILGGPGHVRVSPIIVNTEPGVGSPGGRYRSAYPLPDSTNRLLISWSQCRVIEGGNTVPCTSQRLSQVPALPLAPPLFGIYIYNLNNNTQLPIVVPTEGIIYSDVVAAAQRAAPPIIADRLSGVDYAAELASQAAGVLDIKSVYDFDGVDRAPSGIATVRDPVATPIAQRPARFLRIEKAVSLPDEDVRDIRNTAFGPSGNYMREILGYTPIEPDGSVRVKVPANVALQFSIVDSNARRLTFANGQGFFSPLHRNWLQLRPGEVLSCNGCHTPQVATAANPRSHGRSNLFASANPGAPANGLYPNTDTILQGNPGETMAQTRARAMCRMSLGAACGPSVNVIFDDVWAVPPTPPAMRASFDYCYSTGPTDVGSDAGDPNIKHVCATGITTAAPVSATCETAWDSRCRIVINYRMNIQPLWSTPRVAGAADNACLTCHTPTDAANANRVPAGQLDLSATDDQGQPDHFTSYRKLLFTHNAQELNGTMLRDICVLPRDPVTDNCPDFGGDGNANNDFVTVSAPMIATFARNSRFFAALNNPTHAGFMTEAEKRLISEWLDIGAQYYNDRSSHPKTNSAR